MFNKNNDINQPPVPLCTPENRGKKARSETMKYISTGNASTENC